MLDLWICAVGRLPAASPERALVEDYARRLGPAGRAVGLGPLSVREADTRKAKGMAAEADALRAALPAASGRVLVAMDERGRTLDSPGLAGRLAAWRDGGVPACAFVIGGADGLDPSLRAEADLALSFGPMVWPHALARAMLAEQLYRAAGILAGTPYHRA